MQRQLELELIRKCKAGQSRFYEPLVRAYEQPGYRLAVAMMGNTEDAKDALQMAFIKTYSSLPKFDLRRPFGPWFFQILRNQCRDMLRSRAARFDTESLDRVHEPRAGAAEAGPGQIRISLAVFRDQRGERDDFVSAASPAWSIWFWPTPGIRTTYRFRLT